MNVRVLLAVAACAVAGLTATAYALGGTVPAAMPAAVATQQQPADDGRPAAPASPQVLAGAMAYVDAVNAGDLDALAGSFAPDAVITDVNRDIVGRHRIREWADREVIGGSLRILEVVEDRPDGQKLLVHWAPGGSGGWRAHYDFTLAADGLITAADLQYA